MRAAAILMMLTFSASGLAQERRLTPPEPSGNELRQPAEPVVAASLNAHGGAAIAAIQAITLRGQSESGAGRHPVTISATTDGYGRIEWGEPVHRSLVTTPEGRHDWRQGVLHIRPPHSGAYTTLDIFSVLAMRDTYASGKNRGVVGTAALAEREVFRIHAGTDREQNHYGIAVRDETDVDFDPATGLVAAIHRREFADESLEFPFVTTHTFADYRQVAGVLLPFRIERYRDGRLMEIVAVESFDINPVFERDFFELKR